jgi:hypothetical protein
MKLLFILLLPFTLLAGPIEDIQLDINELVIERDALPVGDLKIDKIQKSIDRLAKRRETLIWRKRISDLPDLRLAMVKANLNQPNSKLFIRDLLKSRDEAKIALLESFSDEITQLLLVESNSSREYEEALDRIKLMDTKEMSPVLKDIVRVLQGR